MIIQCPLHAFISLYLLFWPEQGLSSAGRALRAEEGARGSHGC